MSVLVSLFVLFAPFGGQDAPQPAQVKWLKKHAVSLQTVEAESGFKDLAPLREIIGDARVVALGESTHGSREQFQAKHRLVEYLATELGFNTFSIEASIPESFAVDDYVSRGEGDPVELIRGMYFWTWSTEEVLAMVEWMRAFNKRHARRGERSIRFTGFDMQTPDIAARIVADNVARVDADHAASIRERYAAAKSARAGALGWAPATGSLDPALVAGRRIVFRGQIKSKDVGYAALWFRADSGGKSAAFLNTKTQHKAGDGWVEHTIELEIPAEIDNVNWGLIHSGGGTAWFDDLSLTVDGEPLEPEGFDLAMEKDGRGFRVFSRDYRGRIDTKEKAVGEASFRIDQVGAQPSSSGNEIDPTEAQVVAEELVAELDAMKEELTAALGAKDAHWTVQMARVVAQCMESRAARRGGGGVRDRAMAENVLWILEQDPDARVILWAHNGHVSNDTIWMGNHLKRELGDDYLPIGFATSRGEYRAMAQDGRSGLMNHALHAAPDGSIESFFEAAKLELALLDLRGAEEGSPESGWLLEPRPMRSIGAMEMDRQFFPAATFPKFDVLLYVAETTGAWPLRAKWTDAPPKGER